MIFVNNNLLIFLDVHCPFVLNYRWFRLSHLSITSFFKDICYFWSVKSGSTISWKTRIIFYSLNISNILENFELVFLKEDIHRFISITELFLSHIRGLRYNGFKKGYFFLGHPVCVIGKIQRSLVKKWDIIEEFDPSSLFLLKKFDCL